ncbi:MAG: EcsC family protein [Chromatiales bacterium]|nr:EcsC family protein [Chromatiales bacterium]
MKLTKPDTAALNEAYQRLENPSLAIQLSSAAGMPVETVLKTLARRVPESVMDAVRQSSQKSLHYVMSNTTRTLKDQVLVSASPRLHQAAVMATGAVGGLFGVHALVIELPITTSIMFRSIVDIARAEGEMPRDSDTLLNAMQVFAMGSGMSDKDDAAETSYYGVRLALSAAVSNAMEQLAIHGLNKASSPALLRLVSAIASRFGIVVTQKTMAQALPVVGALGGATINTMFIHHYQEMARGHFTVRRLERKYGVETIREAYQRLGPSPGKVIDVSGK